MVDSCALLMFLACRWDDKYPNDKWEQQPDSSAKRSNAEWLADRGRRAFEHELPNLKHRPWFWSLARSDSQDSDLAGHAEPEINYHAVGDTERWAIDFPLYILLESKHNLLAEGDPGEQGLRDGLRRCNEFRQQLGTDYTQRARDITGGNYKKLKATTCSFVQQWEQHANADITTRYQQLCDDFERLEEESAQLDVETLRAENDQMFSQLSLCRSDHSSTGPMDIQSLLGAKEVDVFLSYAVNDTGEVSIQLLQPQLYGLVCI